MKLLIFDFDGIIIDTETPDYVSWQEMFRQHGCELDMAAWADCIGARADAFDPCAYLESLLGRPVDRDDILARRRKSFLDMVAREPLRPGLLAYLRDARRMGIKLSVASSAGRPWVTDHLARFGLLDEFDCIRTVEDVAQAKPAPDLFLAVLEATGTPAHEAVVFEDSPNGICAARTAAIPCVAVPNPITSQLPLDHADFRIPSFDAMPLESLLAAIRLNNGKCP